MFSGLRTCELYGLFEGIVEGLLHSLLSTRVYAANQLGVAKSMSGSTMPYSKCSKSRNLGLKLQRHFITPFCMCCRLNWLAQLQRKVAKEPHMILGLEGDSMLAKEV